MIPVVTPAEMRAVDAAAPEPVEVLIDRAGAAVARTAIDMLGGTYGRRVVVIAGTGNNGADGRAAARRLARRGIAVTVLDAAHPGDRVPPCDLVLDAAYGTGFRGQWQPPDPGGAPVLAVDIPSGVDGATGVVASPVLTAERTVTFAALKPGLLFPPGQAYAGEISVVDIGLDVSSAGSHVVEASDVAAWVPPRAVDAHKWRAAVWIIAGSPGMSGAAHLSSRAAQRAGAGMVWLSSPGLSSDPAAPTEVVGHALPHARWSADVLDDSGRFQALVVGPGLGRADETATSVRELVGKSPLPVLVDGDGLFALAWSSDGPGPVLRARSAPAVITPHDGEYQLLTGHRPPVDRIAATRQLAAEVRCVVLLKGPTTVVAEPDGTTLLATAGDARLATAGTGDVLSGIIGALLAQQVEPGRAAAAGAWLHGEAAQLGFARGLVAGDLPDLLPRVFAALSTAAWH
jgi:NAD(P)H-hydrate epimerase